MRTVLREAICWSVAFNVMLGTAVAAFAVPIPWLREAFMDHGPAMGVWAISTSAGWLAARLMHRALS